MKYYFLTCLLIITSIAKEINLNKADKIVGHNQGYYVNICELFQNDKDCKNNQLLTGESINNSNLDSLNLQLLRDAFKKEKSSNLRDQPNYYLDNINNKNLNEILLYTIKNFNMLENHKNIDLFLEAIEELLQKKLTTDFDNITLRNYINNKNYTKEKVVQLQKESNIYSDNKYRFVKKDITINTLINNKDNPKNKVIIKKKMDDINSTNDANNGNDKTLINNKTNNSNDKKKITIKNRKKK
jgi:hypothetical protein